MCSVAPSLSVSLPVTAHAHRVIPSAHVRCARERHSRETGLGRPVRKEPVTRALTLCPSALPQGWGLRILSPKIRARKRLHPISRDPQPRGAQRFQVRAILWGPSTATPPRLHAPEYPQETPLGPCKRNAWPRCLKKNTLNMAKYTHASVMDAFSGPSCAHVPCHWLVVS